MQRFQYKNLKEFNESENSKKIDSKTLCVLDIDGVFFHGLTDPHFWFANIKKEYLDELEKIVQRKTNIWIFTDRNMFGFWGPYKKQLLDILSEQGKTLVRRFKGSKEFLNKTKTEKQLNRALILNANKPGQDSKNVIIKGMSNFNKVFYIAAQDIPGLYDDERIVNEIKAGKINLYFIDIRK